MERNDDGIDYLHKKKKHNASSAPVVDHSTVREVLMRAYWAVRKRYEQQKIAQDGLVSRTFILFN